MKKTFTYEFEGRGYYLASSDEYEYESIEYEYCVFEEDLLEAIVDCVYDNYYRAKSDLSYNAEFVGVVKKGLKAFIENEYILEQLVEDYEDELKEYFRDDAFEEYERG